jgi:hypothetical protein
MCCLWDRFRIENQEESKAEDGHHSEEDEAAEPAEVRQDDTAGNNADICRNGSCKVEERIDLGSQSKIERG